jgi:protein arginine N-methyltransferase 1
MIECEPRMPVYAEAMRRAITPGCTVIDLGAAFGVFALLACKLGAGKVIAIEPDPSIELLMPLAKANGCADRITVIRDISTRFTPDQKAEVIVSDCRGTLPLFQHHIATLADARARLLAPGGTLLPMRDTIRVALARWPKLDRDRRRPWLANRYGLDLSAGHRFAINLERKAYLKPGALMSGAAEYAVLDYRSITEPNVDRTVTLVADRSGSVDGLLMWFDAEIAEGLTYSNAPGQPELVYGQLFLPLARRVSLTQGDAVTVRIRGNLVDDEYIWSWDWHVTRAQTGAASAPVQQSTFLKHVFAPGEIARRSNERVVSNRSRLAMAQECLEMAAEGRCYGEIAEILAERHPAQLSHRKAALDFVIDLLRRCD